MKLFIQLLHRSVLKNGKIENATDESMKMIISEQPKISISSLFQKDECDESKIILTINSYLVAIYLIGLCQIDLSNIYLAEFHNQSPECFQHLSKTLQQLSEIAFFSNSLIYQYRENKSETVMEVFSKVVDLITHLFEEDPLSPVSRLWLLQCLLIASENLIGRERYESAAVCAMTVIQITQDARDHYMGSQASRKFTMGVGPTLSLPVSLGLAYYYLGFCLDKLSPRHRAQNRERVAESAVTDIPQSLTEMFVKESGNVANFWSMAPEECFLEARNTLRRNGCEEVSTELLWAVNDWESRRNCKKIIRIQSAQRRQAQRASRDRSRRPVSADAAMTRSARATHHPNHQTIPPALSQRLGDPGDSGICPPIVPSVPPVGTAPPFRGNSKGLEELLVRNERRPIVLAASNTSAYTNDVRSGGRLSETESVVLIQKRVRGWLVRGKVQLLKDLLEHLCLSRSLGRRWKELAGERRQFAQEQQAFQQECARLNRAVSFPDNISQASNAQHRELVSLFPSSETNAVDSTAPDITVPSVRATSLPSPRDAESRAYRHYPIRGGLSSHAQSHSQSAKSLCLRRTQAPSFSGRTAGVPSHSSRYKQVVQELMLEREDFVFEIEALKAELQETCESRGRLESQYLESRERVRQLVVEKQQLEGAVRTHRSQLKTHSDTLSLLRNTMGMRVEDLEASVLEERRRRFTERDVFAMETASLRTAAQEKDYLNRSLRQEKDQLVSANRDLKTEVDREKERVRGLVELVDIQQRLIDGVTAKLAKAQGIRVKGPTLGDHRILLELRQINKMVSSLNSEPITTTSTHSPMESMRSRSPSVSPKTSFIVGPRSGVLMSRNRIPDDQQQEEAAAGGTPTTDADMTKGLATLPPPENEQNEALKRPKSASAILTTSLVTAADPSLVRGIDVKLLSNLRVPGLAEFFVQRSPQIHDVDSTPTALPKYALSTLASRSRRSSVESYEIRSVVSSTSSWRKGTAQKPSFASSAPRKLFGYA